MRLFWIFTLALALMASIAFQTANGQRERGGPNQGLDRHREGPGKHHPGIGGNRGRPGDRSQSRQRPRPRDGPGRGGRPNKGDRRPNNKGPNQRGNRD